MFRDLYDELLSELTEEGMSSEFKDAKNSYFKVHDNVFQDDQEFENRMSLFTDWFLFDRPMDSWGCSPVHHFLNGGFRTLSAVERRLYSPFADDIHGVFLAKKADGPQATLDNLLEKRSCVVGDEENPIRLTKGYLLEARLVEFGGTWVSTDAVVLHPPDVLGLIKGEIKRLNKKYRKRRKGPDLSDEKREAQKALLRLLADINLRYQHYKHVGAEEIYEKSLIEAREEEG